MVLNQSVLHYPEGCSAVWADCQPLHAAIPLASRTIAEQFSIRIGAWVENEKFRQDLDAPEKMTLTIELK
jgi:hypothetical protein